MRNLMHASLSKSEGISSGNSPSCGMLKVVVCLCGWWCNTQTHTQELKKSANCIKVITGLFISLSICTWTRYDTHKSIPWIWDLVWDTWYDQSPKLKCWELFLKVMFKPLISFMMAQGCWKLFQAGVAIGYNVTYIASAQSAENFAYLLASSWNISDSLNAGQDETQS